MQEPMEGQGGRGQGSSPGVERGGEIEETKGDLLSKSLFLIVF